MIERELQFKTGAPLGLEELTESRRRLSALGLFRRIQISAISHGDPSLRDVIVAVEEAPQTTIGGGGGLEVDRRLRVTGTDTTAADVYEFAPRGFFEIGRRNLGGANRSVNLYTRLSLRPEHRHTDTTDRNLFGFSEYRVVGTYREPRALKQLRRPDRHRRGRAGCAHRLQLRPQGLQRRPVASASRRRSAAAGATR